MVFGGSAILAASLKSAAIYTALGASCFTFFGVSLAQAQADGDAGYYDLMFLDVVFSALSLKGAKSCFDNAYNVSTASNTAKSSTNTSTQNTNTAKGSNKSSNNYIPMDENGNPIPLRKHGQADIPLPDHLAEGSPHTVIGGKISSETGEVYRQTATFNGGSWPTENGIEVPISEVHWTNHGRLDVHPNPHQHVFKYDFEQKQWVRSGPIKFYY